MDRFVCRIGTVAFMCPPSGWAWCWCSFQRQPQTAAEQRCYGIGKSGDMADRLRHLVLPLIVMVASTCGITLT